MSEKIKMSCLSLAGRKHSDKGQENEDAVLTLFQNGVHIVCISDGAGGSRYTDAAMGSNSVVRTVTELLTKHFDAFYHDVRENVIRSILVTAIQSELAILANEHGIDGIERMSATMLFCAVKDSRMLCGHIGDGLIAKITSSGIVPITIPQNGENSGSTFFVTFPDAQDYLRLVKTTTDDAHAIVLMTDGLSDMVYDASTYLIRPVVAHLAELADLPEEEKNAQLKETVQNFVINPSNISDDASVGIMYFSGTEVPDSAKFVSEKPLPNADYKDVMRNVQLELLPRVKLARSIVRHDPARAESASEITSVIQAEEPSLPETIENESKPVAETPPVRVKPPRRAFIFGFLALLAIASLIALFIHFIL
jgi:serine/threonine protein phosphatase PrpC